MKDLRIVYAGTRDRYFFPELWCESAMRRLQELDVEVEIPDFDMNAAPEQWQDFLAGADAIVTTWNSPRIDQSILDRTPDLKIVGHAAGSVAAYVSPELFAKAKVTGANDAMAHAVAEWCLLGGLMARRNVLAYTDFAGSRVPDFPGRSNCSSIRGSVVGIWGFGAVAAHLLEMLRPLLPAKVLVNSRHMSAEEAEKLGVTLVSLEELLAQSDVVFTLAGLSQYTVGQLNAERLALLKDGAVLINGGRGELAEEDALIAELRKGRIQAVLDVFHKEPLPADNPLITLPNVILTPHNAGYPSRNHYIPMVVEEILRCFRGEPLRYEIKAEQVAFMTVSAATLKK